MPPKPSQLLFLWTLCIFFFFFFFFFTRSTEANNYLTTHCQNATVLSPNTTFASNLNHLLSALTSHSTASSGFFAASAGNTSAAHGLFLCRGDLSAAACRSCVASAAANLTLNCPAGRSAAVWYSDCTLRYSDRRAFSPAETSPIFSYHNLETAVDSAAFLRVLNNTLSRLISTIGENVAAGKLYSTVRQVGEPAFPAMYGLAQCVPELGVNDCRICLRLAIRELPICCGGKIGARVLLPNCNIRYEPYVFFNTTTTRNGSSIDSIPSAAKRKNWVPLIITLGVVVPVLVLVAVLAVACRLRIQKQKSKGEEDISMVDSLQYDMRTIIAATGNFSDDNKLGEGGFGAVYKGVLPSGQEIAAKRLSRTSMQGVDEFRNEIELVAKLQHRNLVRLLGICFQEEEKILVYEFVPNKSLDYLIFDAEKGVQLDWSIRYKIIVGTARGLLYLHEDSRLRIVHRDLKASNVLLDGDMNPKISDFGMARMFGGDETQGNTCRIVGTYGYMSPEYVMFGHFSTKSDVYSFGILVLEIICGMKNSLSYKLGEGEGLLHYAWRHWTNGTHMELLDPNLRGSCSIEELKRCIHIGLLCVQEEVEDRPTMASVIFMLNGDSVCPEMPQHPAFLSKGRLGNGMSGSCSMNLYDEETDESPALSLSEETSEYR